MPRNIDLQQLEAASQQVAAKLHAFQQGLTEGEQLVLDQAIRRVVAGGDETEARGFAAAVYEGDFGYKGRPGTNPGSQPTAGGSKLVPTILTGVFFVLTAGNVHADGEYPR